ncbi:MAG: response regulator [Nanoarchaeota archaeon]|nr:response regulator [Nanoarchaeota archaeon]MBU0963405.1 response regulator [Nanoarchaeota archaeon]
MVNTLIVDDIQKWHDVVEKNLFYFGFNGFLHAYNIKEGLVFYQAHKPELVITDINFDPSNPSNIQKMTGNLDGLVLCNEIRNQSKDVKIVVMSSIKEAEEVAKRSGADYFIEKIYFKDQIEDFIRQNYRNVIR